MQTRPNHSPLSAKEILDYEAILAIGLSCHSIKLLADDISDTLYPRQNQGQRTAKSTANIETGRDLLRSQGSHAFGSYSSMSMLAFSCWKIQERVMTYTQSLFCSKFKENVAHRGSSQLAKGGTCRVDHRCLTSRASLDRLRLKLPPKNTTNNSHQNQKQTRLIEKRYHRLKVIESEDGGKRLMLLSKRLTKSMYPHSDVCVASKRRQ